MLGRRRSARITDLTQTICREFGDNKPNSTVSQIHRLWAASGLDESQLLDWLYLLRSQVREGLQVGHVRKAMPYFMQVLRSSLRARADVPADTTTGDTGTGDTGTH